MPAIKRRVTRTRGGYRHTLKELGRFAYTMCHAEGGYTCLGCGRHIATGFTNHAVPGVRCRDCFVDYMQELEQVRET
ncbi:MAG TPA: hypothetical protein VGQ71_14320 [Terriglobales bacterium]|jgi:hypothetical protein|nr:hypothetical protein [Terriglobales bacterium]